MREKLIKLVKQAMNDNVLVCPDDFETEVIIDYEKIVDYLISNNVTVPPCEIGDDIWVPKILRDEIHKTKAVGFTYNVVVSPYNEYPFRDVRTSKAEALKMIKE